MSEKIGTLIERKAKEHGLSLQQLGSKINRTKPGVASIYKRSTIDTELLKKLVEVLDYDFFAHYYKEEPLLRFKETETAAWQAKIDTLEERLQQKTELLQSKDEVLILQRKYIVELEEKLSHSK